MVEEINEGRDQGEDLQEDQRTTVPGAEQAAQQEQKTAADAAVEAPEAVTVEVDIEGLFQEIESLKQQAAANLDKALRAQAEMENLRKRSAREIENAHKYGLDRFLKDLLPIIDSLELGISVSDNAGDVTGLREGMDLTLKMFIDVLNKSGVEIIDPQGEKFDPELHEAVSVQVLEGGQSGTVTAVMQKGYSLNGRLVRPAMVVVAR